jgi:hypothetical protein
LKLCAVSCEVFARECSRAAAVSPHVVTVKFLHFGLHDRPDELRKTVQAEIDDASGGEYDSIVLAYGLCSRGTADLVARDTPIVIPRAHDCITLLLGSRESYDREFAEHPGTYYYSPGWIERKEGEVRQGNIEVVNDRRAEERFRQYVEKYGEDNARYLIEQETLWLANYHRAALIDVGLGDIEYYRRFTRQVAENRDWTYEEIPGDTSLLDRLLSADWDSSADFLTVPPGRRTIEDVNSGIISVV